jgi:hypothetical protein
MSWQEGNDIQQSGVLDDETTVMETEQDNNEVRNRGASNKSAGTKNN